VTWVDNTQQDTQQDLNSSSGDTETFSGKKLAVELVKLKLFQLINEMLTELFCSAR
jgi:ASC-1-like (ASCH) protein